MSDLRELDLDDTPEVLVPQLDEAQSASFKSLLQSLDENALAAILAAEPDLLKRASKVVAEAKRQEAVVKTAQTLAIKQEENQDPKLTSKIYKLITGPHNPDNEKALVDLITAGVRVNVRHEGKTLMCQALDYLATKDRVEFVWPYVLLNHDTNMGKEEVQSFLHLVKARGNAGGKFEEFLIKTLLQKQSWKSLEAQLSTDLTNCKANGFIELYYTHVGRNYSSRWTRSHWRVISNLVSNDCAMPPTAAPGGYGSTSEVFWQILSAINLPPAQNTGAPPDPKTIATQTAIAEAKIEAFEIMAKMKWLSHEGTVTIHDNLDPSHDASIRRPGGRDRIIGSPSRCFIQSGALDATALHIFRLFCQYEEQHNLVEPLDPLGRSRLFFVNERARQSAGHHGQNNKDSIEILKSFVAVCIEKGDTPQTLNSQNHYAKATSVLRDTINTLYESKEIGETLAANAPKNTTSKTSRL